MVWPIWPKFSGINKNLDRNTGHRKNLGFSIRIVAFWYWTFFGTKKLCLITLECAVRLICNLSGLCHLMTSIMWQCKNFQFLSEKGPMAMGHFWVPESAVVPKLSNFQPFRFKFGLYSLLLGISTLKTKKFHIA